MVSTLSRNRVREDLPVSFANQKSQRDGFSRVSTGSAARVTQVETAALRNALGTYPVSFNDSLLNGSAVRQPMQAPARPHLVPVESPRRARKPHVLVRVNRGVQATLIALCGVAILGYGYDVAATHEVGKQQDQVRRISEQNAEYSARLLHAVSYDGIQNSVAGHKTLVVPEDVKIVPEVGAPKLKPFKAAKDHLPLMSGY